MRISTSQIFDQNLTAMLNQQSDLSKTQLQVSTGKKILNPSDDPAASVQILNLQREFSLSEQYIANATKAENKQVIEEGVLQSATDMLQRIRELAVQGLNASNTQSDKKAIATEIQQLNEQLLALANTRDSNGDYLFSGFQSNTQPYQTLVGDYQGDEGQRNIKIGAGVFIESNDPGNQVFEAPLISTTMTTTLAPVVTETLDVSSNATLNVTGFSSATNTFSDVTFTYDGTAIPPGYNVSGTGGIPSGPITAFVAVPPDVTSLDLTTLDSNFPALTIDLAGTSVNGDEFTLSSGTGTGQLSVNDITGVSETFPQISFTFNDAVVGPPAVAANYVISDSNGNTASVDYVDGMTVNLSLLNPDFPRLEINLSGSPANGDVLTIEKNVTQPSQTLFKTINNFANALINNAVGANDSPNNGDFLTNLSAALTNIVDTRAEVGGRLNAIEQQNQINDGLSFNMEKTLSELQDLDYAEAISRLSLQTTGLQAAQQSFVQVQGLSLFNFL
ncbi:MAG: flagellar hook-associated protein FlgL [Gammaproteobacteria bacterium]|nr:flagellar hook-associated protein FlgL [Gammaproteobacteria bacterium]